jgi:hypothetical protein
MLEKSVDTASWQSKKIQSEKPAAELTKQYIKKMVHPDKRTFRHDKLNKY